jgi:hypothetical protein
MAEGKDLVTELLVRNLLELFNQKDDAVRRSLLLQMWSEDAIFIDPEAAHVGHKEIDQAIRWLFQSFPGWTFSVAGPVRAQHGVACLPWAYGTEAAPRQITGIDVGRVEGGKIRELYTFIDPKTL